MTRIALGSRVLVGSRWRIRDEAEAEAEDGNDAEDDAEDEEGNDEDNEDEARD